jgi:hypothetical protein
MNQDTKNDSDYQKVDDTIEDPEFAVGAFRKFMSYLLRLYSLKLCVPFNIPLSDEKREKHEVPTSTSGFEVIAISLTHSNSGLPKDG